MLGRLKFEIDNLVNEILDRFPIEGWESDITAFHDPAIGGGQFVKEIERRLREYGHSDKNIASRVSGFETSQLRLNYAINKHGLIGKYQLGDLEANMGGKEFDVIASNPPYTKGAKLLYTYFFKESLDIANIVAIIMPLDLDSGHDKLKFHNKRIKKHASFISENISDHFNVGLSNIHYIIASKNIENVVIENEDKLDKLPLLYPKRKRLKFIAGDTDSGKSKEFEDGTEIVYSILKDDNIITKKIAKEIAKKSKRWTSAPFSVFINYTPSGGHFNCAIVESCIMTWTRKVFMLECQTLEEAKKLKAWLKSKKIQKEVLKMFRIKSETYYTLSLEMANRLPYYE